MGWTYNLEVLLLLFYLTASTDISVFHLKLELSQELLLVLQLVRLLTVVSFVELDLAPLLGLCSLQRFWRLLVLTGVWNNMDRGVHHQWLVFWPCSLLCLGFLQGCLHIHDFQKQDLMTSIGEVINHRLETQVMIMVCCQIFGVVKSLFFLFWRIHSHDIIIEFH